MTHSPHDPIHAHDPGAGPEVVSLRQPQELLTAIPYLLTYQPDHGLVVLGIGDDGDLLVTISAELPLDHQLVPAAAAITGCLAHVATAGLLVVGYCPRDDEPTLVRMVHRLPWPVQDVLRVWDQRWWSLTCTSPSCCPPGGRPLVPQTRVQAPLLAATGAPAASRQSLQASLEPGPDEVLDRVRAHLEDITRTAATRNGGPRAAYAAVQQTYRARSDGERRLPPDRAARLLAALRDQMVRDACVLWHDDDALALWHDLLKSAPAGWAAPVATLLALAAYQRGNSILAGFAAERALEDEPGYSLAELVSEAVRRGLPPQGLSESLAEVLLSRNPLLTDPPTPS